MREAVGPPLPNTAIPKAGRQSIGSTLAPCEALQM